MYINENIGYNYAPRGNTEDGETLNFKFLAFDTSVDLIQFPNCFVLILVDFKYPTLFVSTEDLLRKAKCWQNQDANIQEKTQKSVL